MPTTTPDPTQIAAEQKVLAPQTMPEERTNQNVLEAGGCSWRDDVVENGYTWNPRVLPYGEVQCVSCACKVNFLNRILKSIYSGKATKIGKNDHNDVLTVMSNRKKTVGFFSECCVLFLILSELYY